MSKIGFQENDPFPGGFFWYKPPILRAIPGGEECFCTATRSMHGSIITKKKDPTWFKIFIRIIISVECKQFRESYPNQPLSVNGLGTESVMFHAFKMAPCLDQPCYCNPYGMACLASMTKLIKSHGGDKIEPMPQWAQDMIAIPPVGNTWGFRHPLIVPLEAAIVKQVQEPENMGFGPYERDGMPKCSSMKKKKECCPPRQQT
jgi:hypothetical protein